MSLTMSVANATSYIQQRRAGPVCCSVERLERSIAEMRMAAAIGIDWEQIHVRSREIAKRVDGHEFAGRQIAAVRQIRAELYQASDSLGLRALRLATAGPMAGWLQGEATSVEAQALARLFAEDQCLGIPGLADLEAELEQTRMTPDR